MHSHGYNLLVDPDHTAWPTCQQTHWMRWVYALTDECVLCLPSVRAVLLGYNVMIIDSDSAPLSDFYWKVKQPPLSKYQMLSQSEGGGSINGGFTYVQNAKSNGPVAWVLFEMVHRTSRFSEDSKAFQQWGIHGEHLRWLRRREIKGASPSLVMPG